MAERAPFANRQKFQNIPAEGGLTNASGNTHIKSMVNKSRASGVLGDAGSRTMAKANKTQAAANGAPQIDVANMLDTNGENLKAMMRTNEAILEGLAELGREMIAFGNARLRQDLEASECLMGCKDAGEAFRLQVDFARTAGEQYYNEASKLMELANKMAKECWNPIEDRTQATFQSLNKSQ
jgi:phasin family protein